MFKLLPDKDLRDVILQRNISVKEVETLLRNKTDLLEEIDGPNIALNDLNKWERGLVRAGQVQDAATSAMRHLDRSESKSISVAWEQLQLAKHTAMKR